MNSISFKFLLTLFFCFGLFNFSFSQNKIERELRVKPSEVPVAAKDWLNDAFEGARKPKWHLEYSQNGKSYEAKFRYKGNFHSVEFDSLGNVQDVEIEIKESEVAPEVWREIQSYFVLGYDQVKVEKIQRQLTGSKSVLEDYFDEDKVEGVQIRYEIVYQGKSIRWELWEALFDDSGKLISKLKVEIRPNHNLIF